MTDIDTKEKIAQDIAERADEERAGHFHYGTVTADELDAFADRIRALSASQGVGAEPVAWRLRWKGDAQCPDGTRFSYQEADQVVPPDWVCQPLYASAPPSSQQSEQEAVAYLSELHKVAHPGRADHGAKGNYECLLDGLLSDAIEGPLPVAKEADKAAHFLNRWVLFGESLHLARNLLAETKAFLHAAPSPAAPTVDENAQAMRDGQMILKGAMIGEFIHKPDGKDARDAARLNHLATNHLDLRCFDIPTGGDDSDVGWRVIEHHMAPPHERIVGIVYSDDPRKAIDAAMLPPTERTGEKG